MNHPEYIAPVTLKIALNIKQANAANARVIAGGTDLILRMRDKVMSPKVLIDLRRIALDTILRENGAMHLGPYVSLAQLLASAEIAALFPALAEACRSFAGPPIRNRATLGGNLVNASPAGDLIPPLMAYDANVVLASFSGERVLPLTKFFTGPGQTVMRPDELLTEVQLPLMPPDTTAVFTKLGQRRSMAISIVNVCTRITLTAVGNVRDARVVMGCVAPTPIRAIGAEAVLTGQELSTDLITQAAVMAQQETSPITDVRASAAYRKRVTQVLVRRALQTCCEDLGRNTQ